MTTETIARTWQAEAGDVLAERFTRPGYRYGTEYAPAAEWAAHLREGIPAAFTAMFTNTIMDNLLTATPLNLGREFRNALRRTTGTGWTPGDRRLEAMGTWIRNQWPLVQSFANPSIYPGDLETERLRINHGAMLRGLHVWAEDDEQPCYDSVDEAMVGLSVNTDQRRRLWPTDECGTSGEAKDFLGAVLRYKRWHLAQAVRNTNPPPVQERPVWRVGSTARVTRDRPLNAWCVAGDLVRLVETRRAGSDGVPCFFVQEILPDGTDAPTRREYHYVPVSALEPYEPVTLEATLSGEDERYRALVAAVQHDFQIISRSMGQEAQRRGWCGEYESVVSRFNESLQVPGLVPQVRLFPARVEQTDHTLRVWASLVGTIGGCTYTMDRFEFDVTASAYDEEGAREAVSRRLVLDALLDALPEDADNVTDLRDWGFV